MKITDEARNSLNELLKEKEGYIVKISEREGCCGSSIYLSLEKKEGGVEVEEINGVPVTMDEAAKKRAESVTLDMEEGKLAILDEEEASGCC